jgi:16S rRNA (guanine966-N2)-methyltransferase
VTRPATARVRQSIFSRLGARTGLSGARVLDLYAGSGSLGLEALSRGAAFAVFVDKSRAASSTIRANLSSLGLVHCAEIISADAFHALGALAARGDKFDLVFIDAPYANDNSAALLERVVATEILASHGWVVVRQAEQAYRITPGMLDEVSIGTVGDHRISLYRRPSPRDAA